MPIRKRLLWIVSAIFLLSSTSFALELVWEKDAPTAFAKAKVENKNVVLIVEAKYCKWCKKLKATTLADERVIKRLQNYVLVKIRRCDKKAMSIMPESYYPAPSTFFMTPEKEIIEKAIGYFEADDFLSYIDDVEEQ